MDMLVKLYDLPDVADINHKLSEQGIFIKPVLPPEKTIVVNWIRENFSEGWACEAEAAIFNKPSSCFIAHKDQTIVGFGCYDSINKNFFGPTGVSEGYRGFGIGKALLIHCLDAMKGLGYAYAIIGAVGPKEFYKKMVGAVEIVDSTPSIYKNLLS